MTGSMLWFSVVTTKKDDKAGISLHSCPARTVGQFRPVTPKGLFIEKALSQFVPFIFCRQHSKGLFV